MDKVQKVIQSAEKFLENNSYDQGHDLDHHLSVWKNAQNISSHIHLAVNNEALHIACMWHDVVTTHITNRNFVNREKMTLQTADYVTKLMTDLQFDNDIIQKTVVAIKEHDRNSKQTTMEGKILYDADKLEFLNVKRWFKILNAVKTGRMAKIKLFLYKREGKKYLSKLRHMYNFDYTRDLHDKKVKEILNNKDINKVADDMGENLQELLLGK